METVDLGEDRVFQFIADLSGMPFSRRWFCQNRSVERPKHVDF